MREAHEIACNSSIYSICEIKTKIRCIVSVVTHHSLCQDGLGHS